PAPPVPDLRGAELGAEPAIASAHQDGAPWPRLAPGVRGRRARRLHRAHHRRRRRDRRGRAAARRGGAAGWLRPAERRAAGCVRSGVHRDRHRAFRATLRLPRPPGTGDAVPATPGKRTAGSLPLVAASGISLLLAGAALVLRTP